MPGGHKWGSFLEPKLQQTTYKQNQKNVNSVYTKVRQPGNSIRLSLNLKSTNGKLVI